MLRVAACNADSKFLIGAICRAVTDSFLRIDLMSLPGENVDVIKPAVKSGR